ncbi:MAG: adenine phosphoribosyltransferase [Cyanobacteria bacterium SW_9_44_58]|nr:MAG: adenine phosphoribosyltransferase [Cyanobacteria bacterium SW_9_44_58]
MDLKTLIRNIHDFPKPGIVFRDITTLLRDREGLRYAVETFESKFREANLIPDYVIGIESRGFLFGPTLAYKLNAGFVPVRKPGKLPAAVHSIEYDLEYGSDKLEMHQDALPANSKVIVIDDLMATGGTAKATAELLEKIDCQLLGFGFVIELEELEGRNKLPDVPVISLVAY